MDNWLVLSLVLLSAVLHPLWNMLLKGSRDKVVFYFNIHLFFTVIFAFLLFIYPLKTISAFGWLLIAFSSLTHFFYQIYLCRSYELGDMSMVYPITRSSPLFVALMGFVFLGEKVSFPAVISIAAIVIGVFVLNQRDLSFKGFFSSWSHVNRKAVFAALMTALFSASYSVVDKKGAQEISPVLFFYLFFALSGLLFGVYLFFYKKRLEGYWNSTIKDKGSILVACLLEFSSYILILYAFRMAKVAYVIAVRQISVVFGALFGVLMLKERYGFSRIIGSLIIFAGIYFLTVCN